MHEINVEKREPYMIDGFTSDYERAATEGATVAEQEWALEQAFRAAVDVGDAYAIATWAPTITEYAKQGAPERHQIVGEVVHDALDASGHSFDVEAAEILMAAAKSTDIDLALKAGDLLGRMAGRFGWSNAR
jgi:hypothetical protein